MTHTNPATNIVKSRTISRPPLQTIPTKLLQYNLSSTNTHNTQNSVYSLEYNTQMITSNISIQHHNVPVLHQSPHDKIRTHDLTLEVNSITNQLQSKNVETQSEHLMFRHPRDPNNKHKPAYKKYCSFCDRTNYSISACSKKKRDDEDKRDAYARSKSFQKSIVQYFRSSCENNSYRTHNKPTESYARYRSRSTSRYSNTNRNSSSQNRYRCHSRDQYRYDRTTTPPEFNRSSYDNYRRDSRSYRSSNRSSYR